MVGSLLLWLLVRAEPDLLAKSKLLVDYDKRVIVFKGIPAPDYCWINADEILFSPDEGSLDSNVHWHAFDVQTGKSREIPGLHRTDYSSARWGPPVVDPSGKLLMWRTNIDRTPGWEITDMDGKSLGRWAGHGHLLTWSHFYQEENRACWSADGKSVLESVLKTDQGSVGVQVWRRTRSDLTHETDFPFMSPAETTLLTVPIVDLGDDGIEWIAPLDPWQRKLAAAKITSWQPGAPEHRHDVTLDFPDSEGIPQCEVSPDHREILWATGSGTRRELDLWVSKIDGSQLQKLGFVKIDERTPLLEKGLHFPHWVQGRHAISFLYDHSLYEVPVP